MTARVRLPTTCATLAAVFAVAAWDTAAAFDVIAPQVDAAAQADEVPEADAAETIEPSDWSALSWRPGMNAADRSKRTGMKASATSSASATSWSRTDNADGTAAVTVKRSLPMAWETNVGADFVTAPPPSALPGRADPAALLRGGTADPSAGAAWASVATPPLDAPVGWDKAALDARVDPVHEHGKVGVSASKSLGGHLSLTLQGGYAVTDAFASGIATPAGAPPGTTVHAAPAYTTEQGAKLTILPTQTAVTAGRTMSTADARWLHALSAEQALFAGASIIGSVSESVEGPLTTSIVAKYQRRW